MAKYQFTSEMDNEIIHTYSINTDNKPRLINLARKFNMPRWAIYQRALRIGAVTSSHQKRKWEDEEIKILEKNADSPGLRISGKISHYEKSEESCETA